MKEKTIGKTVFDRNKMQIIKTEVKCKECGTWYEVNGETFYSLICSKCIK